MRIAIIFLFCLWVAYIVRPEPMYYVIESVSGVLVDEVVGEPVEGAAVLVTWGAQEGFFIRPQSSGWWAMRQTITNGSGYFFFGGVVSLN